MIHVVLVLCALVLVSGSICGNPGSFSGQSLCYPSGKYCGQCVSFYKVCSGDSRTTSQWRKGIQVKGNNIPFGTGIATFSGGSYYGHTAIYIGQNDVGIQVWDQWVGHPVSQRTIKWNGSGVSNNGNSFFVIQ
eukprot:TRINITY_DN5873_c0_g1_i1.p1 TRINITY_DN5873_c0_g1~~TRINITY_DN5873_c0_g1_i1.p1  ORF type:complete len:133 (-),score=13.15 TRINITY_DN5873_c0_g1_i1:23-421(-)